MAEETHENDIAFIKALAEILNEKDLNEIEVSREYSGEASLSVHISRGQNGMAIGTALPAASPTVATMDQAQTNDPAQHPGAVTSPMVGSVYLQPEPGAAPFVRSGETVKEGDTLLIIEAMKTMNHIPAPKSGVVQRVLVDDGAAVEFGTPLMIVE